MCQTV